jgi:hypothetical protein
VAESAWIEHTSEQALPILETCQLQFHRCIVCRYRLLLLLAFQQIDGMFEGFRVMESGQHDSHSNEDNCWKQICSRDEV